MCEAHAYILKDGTEEKVLESVDQVTVKNNEIWMVNIFGEQKILKARLLSYNANERKILLEVID